MTRSRGETGADRLWHVKITVVLPVRSILEDAPTSPGQGRGMFRR
ncbi:hypothetical protein [Streptomyces bicolor]|nr:hypothetical protein [Streptomyces bicolor]